MAVSCVTQCELELSRDSSLAYEFGHTRAIEKSKLAG